MVAPHLGALGATAELDAAQRGAGVGHLAGGVERARRRDVFDPAQHPVVEDRDVVGERQDRRPAAEIGRALDDLGQRPGEELAAADRHVEAADRGDRAAAQHLDPQILQPDPGQPALEAGPRRVGERADVRALGRVEQHDAERLAGVDQQIADDVVVAADDQERPRQPGLRPPPGARAAALDRHVLAPDDRDRLGVRARQDAHLAAGFGQRVDRGLDRREPAEARHLVADGVGAAPAQPGLSGKKCGRQSWSRSKLPLVFHRTSASGAKNRRVPWTTRPSSSDHGTT